MRNENPRRLAAVILLAATGAFAQDAPLPANSISVNLKGSPLSLVAMSSDQSRVTARGAAMALDIRMSLTLQNSGTKRIHGVTLRVVSQEVAPGGKGSVTLPSLNIAPGESFPLGIDMQLLRPSQLAVGPLVQVDLDGVLFQDLSFYGPDRLGSSRRSLTACEREAQRDREYLKRVLAQSDKKGLQEAILQIQARAAEVAPLNVRVAHGPAVTSAALPAEHPAQFAFVQFPDSPVEPLEGMALVSGNEARAPNIEVRNRSAKPVRYVELGWVLADQAGREAMAASLPSSDAALFLPPGKTARVLQESTLRLYANTGRAANVGKMTAFINRVEFTDGKVWVPTRQNLEEPALRGTVPPSAEEVRLSNVYLKTGLEGLLAELKKF